MIVYIPIQQLIFLRSARINVTSALQQWESIFNKCPQPTAMDGYAQTFSNLTNGQELPGGD